MTDRRQLAERPRHVETDTVALSLAHGRPLYDRLGHDKGATMTNPNEHLDRQQEHGNAAQ